MILFFIIALVNFNKLVQKQKKIYMFSEDTHGVISTDTTSEDTKKRFHSNWRFMTTFNAKRKHTSILLMLLQIRKAHTNTKGKKNRFVTKINNLRNFHFIAKVR